MLPVGSRIAARVEYYGGPYNGWQAQPQPHSTTVQDTVEAALSYVADAPVRIHCAGRTDSGVHAHAQIIHFDSPTVRSCQAWLRGGNNQLPADIRLHWAMQVPVDFHARFAATARYYRYIIANTSVLPALLQGKVAWHRRPLDADSMHEAAQSLLGEQDFTTFRAAACQSNSPMRHVTAASVERRGELLLLNIVANAFLHHMVRNIAGSLLAVGDGREAPSWIAELLAARDRTAAASTANACGVYLLDVSYPPHFGLPQTPPGPSWLQC